MGFPPRQKEVIDMWHRYCKRCRIGEMLESRDEYSCFRCGAVEYKPRGAPAEFKSIWQSGTMVNLRYLGKREYHMDVMMSVWYTQSETPQSGKRGSALNAHCPREDGISYCGAWMSQLGHPDPRENPTLYTMICNGEDKHQSFIVEQQGELVGWI